MKMMRYLLLVAMAVLPLAMSSAPLDTVAARAVASRFVASGGAVGLRSGAPAALRLAHVEPSASQHAAYYVFLAADGSGFVIVAGDDRARQVLAWGDTPFDVDNVPDNVRWMLDRYKEQMEYLFAHPQAQAASSPIIKSTANVPPLLTTRWGQGRPYRDQCPQVDGRMCATGCVATSMAQVMNYWKYPSTLPAVPAYTTATLKLSLPALPATDVAWDLMLDSYNEGAYTDEQGAAVALLMRYCGQACKMDYGIAGSGAFSIDELRAFQLFGYNPKASFDQRAYFTDEEWHAMLQDDLLAGRPVVYSGSTGYSSHSFVIDGFDDGRYHVNWGWDGAFDGFYELDAMNGGGYKPNKAQAMLHAICPAAEAVDPDFAIDGMCFKRLGFNLVEVTFKDRKFNSYSGDVIVPDTVNHDGKAYVVRAVGDSAFRLCSKLTSVMIPNTVKRIGNEAFRRSGIRSISIPDSVTIIGESAFSRCANLTAVTLNEGLKEIRNYTFLECTKLSDVKLPASITSIGNKAFSKTAITSIVIPNRVTAIGLRAFQGCDSLVRVTLGEAVSDIGENAFNGCHRLAQVVSNALTPPVLKAENCFGADAYATATLYVPESALDDYMTAQYWSLFATIEAIGSVDVNGDGEVNIADVNAIINAILEGGEDPSLDVNCDSEVNIADVNAVISIILQGLS